MQSGWHYQDEKTGARVGPAGDAEINRMVAEGRLVRTTLVWSPGMPDWAKANTTDLASLFNASSPPTKAPLKYDRPFLMPLVAIVCIIGLFPQEAISADFVESYIDSRGGCGSRSTVLAFEQGSSAPSPFGKPAASWTDQDITNLKSVISECIKKPNQFDLAEENSIIDRTYLAISRARQIKSARERNIQAAAEAKIEHQSSQQQEFERGQPTPFAPCNDPEILQGLIEQAKKEIERTKIKHSSADGSDEPDIYTPDFSDIKSLSKENQCRATFSLRGTDNEEVSMGIRYQIRGEDFLWYSSVFDVPKLVSKLDEARRARSAQEAAENAERDSQAETDRLSKSSVEACPDWMSSPMFETVVDFFLTQKRWPDEKANEDDLFKEYRDDLADNAAHAAGWGTERYARVIRNMSRENLKHCLPKVENALEDRENLMRQEHAIEDEEAAAVAAKPKHPDADSLIAEISTNEEEGMGSYSSDGGVQTFHPGYYTVQYIILTSHSDILRIDTIDANRGNCLLTPLARLPVYLKFGETLKVRSSCKPLEIEVKTDEGNKSFDFSE